MIEISEADPTLRRHSRAYFLVGFRLSTSLPARADDTMAALAWEMDAAMTKVSSLCTVTAAEWAEHIAYSTMTRPFAQVFGEEEAPAEVEVVGGGPAPAMTFESDGFEPDRETESEDPPDVAWYEAVYPERAAAIRAHGGVPPDARFGPPDGAMVRALLAVGPSGRGVGPPR